MLTNIELNTAQDILLQRVSPLAVEKVSLIDAFGRINALDLKVPFPIPPCQQAAMDGFALHPSNLSASKALMIKHLEFPQICQYQLQSGETVPVNTGFPLPKGTGAVIANEGVQIQGEYLLTEYDVIPGSNLRLPGEDFQQNELLAAPGKRITPGLISAVAACGITKILAYRKPQVAILSLDPHYGSNEFDRALDLLPDSNGPLLAALVTRDGGKVMCVDDIGNQTLNDVNDTLNDIDLLLTIGGTYSKEQSEAQAQLEEMGVEILFWGTKTQPGGHNGAGIYDSRVVICLSGNPAACAVGYELLAAPVLRRFQGLDPILNRISATCVNDIVITARKIPRFLRGRATCRQNGWAVEALPGQKASMISSLINCNALIEIPGGQTEVKAGSHIDIIMLGRSWCQE